MNGADSPPGSVPDFVRSIPIEKATHADTILAYQNVENLLGGDLADRFVIHREGSQSGTVDGAGTVSRGGRAVGNILELIRHDLRR